MENKTFSQSEVNLLLNEQRIEFVERTVKENREESLKVVDTVNRHYSEIKSLIQAQDMKYVQGQNDMKAYVHEMFVTHEQVDGKIKLLKAQMPLVVITFITSVLTLAVVLNKFSEL